MLTPIQRIEQLAQTLKEHGGSFGHEIACQILEVIELDRHPKPIPHNPDCPDTTKHMEQVKL